MTKKRRTHNYPETRKPRDTRYSMTYKLKEQHGLEKIKEIWVECGMYRTAQKLGTSPYVIRYVAHKHGWKRPAEKAPTIVKGIKNGNAKTSDYRVLDFSNCNLKQEKEDQNDQ